MDYNAWYGIARALETVSIAPHNHNLDHFNLSSDVDVFPVVRILFRMVLHQQFTDFIDYLDPDIVRATWEFDSLDPSSLHNFRAFDENGTLLRSADWVYPYLSSTTLNPPDHGGVLFAGFIGIEFFDVFNIVSWARDQRVML